MSSEVQRRELGALLRARRGQLDRSDLGLPAVGRGRSSGLRREEVASLSGVSVTWYTWLEQGRNISPSTQVLDALARTLRLSTSEHAYVRSLAGHPPPTVPSGPATAAPSSVQRLLDVLVQSPAFALTPHWGIAAWNEAYAALYPGIGDVADDDRNLLWLVFTDPYVRRLLPRWDEDSRRFLAEFRADVGPRLDDPSVSDLVQRLQSVSPEFRDGWTGHRIEGFASRERVFHAPGVGDLSLEHHQLTPSDHPELRIVVYTPVEDGRTPGLLAQLLTGARSVG